MTKHKKTRITLGCGAKETIEERFTRTYGPRSGGAVPVPEIDPLPEDVYEEICAALGRPRVSDTGAESWIVGDVRDLIALGCDVEEDEDGGAS